MATSAALQPLTTSGTASCFCGLTLHLLNPTNAAHECSSAKLLAIGARFGARLVREVWPHNLKASA